MILKVYLQRPSSVYPSVFHIVFVNSYFQKKKKLVYTPVFIYIFFFFIFKLTIVKLKIIKHSILFMYQWYITDFD